MTRRWRRTDRGHRREPTYRERMIRRHQAPGARYQRATGDGRRATGDGRRATTLPLPCCKLHALPAVPFPVSLSGESMPTVITGIARTPIGRFGGAFRPLAAVDLGGVAIAAALQRSGIDPSQIDEVLFGHVIQAGTGQITARQAAVRGGLPMTVPATTINKVCLSGMTAIALGDKDIRLGEAKFVVAG